MTIDLGEVIATRRLQAGARAVVVHVGRPRPKPGSSDQFCPLRITGLEPSPIELEVGGVDSVQALLLALKAIGDCLRHHNEPLTFLGAADLGFPITELR